MPDQTSLFAPTKVSYEPLAARMRPQRLEQIVGQSHLVGRECQFRKTLESGQLFSMILWGPPGSGKTTLARVAAACCEAELIALSAVLCGIKEVREAVARAQRAVDMGQPSSVLFIDEVHRFNKAQQDAFLPHLESGLIRFIGATTENPGFALNNALLSRASVYVLKPLSEHDVRTVLAAAVADTERGLGTDAPHFDAEALAAIAGAADGDARRALGLLESLSAFGVAGGLTHIDQQTVISNSTLTVQRFDRGGDVFYEQISALHKSIRGSDPDAALYWLARMLVAGADPGYIARRLTRIAAEDIGCADSAATQVALASWQAYERLGAPEGELMLAQCAVYLACAPKSNAVYAAFGAARQEASESGSLEVPLHLRNAPTQLQKHLGYGAEYQYDPDHSEGFAAAQTYFPAQLKAKAYYQPTDSGDEAVIASRLAKWRALRSQAQVTDKSQRSERS